jgi:hypothetical protein
MSNSEDDNVRAQPHEGALLERGHGLPLPGGAWLPHLRRSQLRLFRVAAKVEDGDPESWIAAFREMGRRIEDRTEELKEKGRASAAPPSCAFTGYRAASFLMNLKTDFERFSETVESFVRCLPTSRLFRNQRAEGLTNYSERKENLWNSTPIFYRGCGRGTTTS